MKVPLQRAIAATGARALNAAALPAALQITTDSRALERGATFLALRGERFDGHAFAGDALRAGAAAVIVADETAIPAGAPALVVADTLRALLALAGEARAALRGRVVAITGSTGKTTTKELLAQLLAAAGFGNVAATPGNENNEIGVSKLFLGLDPGVNVVVTEFGARRFGDIAPLVAVAKPDVAVLTNVGDAHLEIMGSAQRLADTKWEIFSTGARAVLNEADTVARERAATLAQPPWWFGAPSAEEPHGVHEPAVRIVDNPEAHADRLVRYDSGRADAFPIQIALPGRHNRANLAAACAAMFALGAAAETVAHAIAALRLPAGRYERTRIGDYEIIFDAYNASMGGTLATLDAFAHEPVERRIAVLASMAELGDGSAAMHRRVGAAAASAGIAALLVGGAHADDLERGAREAGLAAHRLVRFEANDDAVRWLRRNTRAGDLVLLKGSRMYHLEEVLEGLRDGG